VQGILHRCREMTELVPDSKPVHRNTQFGSIVRPFYLHVKTASLKFLVPQMYLSARCGRQEGGCRQRLFEGFEVGSGPAESNVILFNRELVR
jgi:hypothetical protein